MIKLKHTRELLTRDWCPKFATDKCPLLDHSFLAFFLAHICFKTELQTVILRCWTGLYLNWFKSYDTNANHAKNITQIFFFYKISKGHKQKYLCFVSQHRLNLSLVKDIHVGAKKWQKMVAKWPFISCKFWASVSSFLVKKHSVTKNSSDLSKDHTSTLDLSLFEIWIHKLL